MTSGLRNQIPQQQPAMPPIQLAKIIACFPTIAVCQHMAILTQPRICDTTIGIDLPSDAEWLDLKEVDALEDIGTLMALKV